MKQTFTAAIHLLLITIVLSTFSCKKAAPAGPVENVPDNNSTASLSRTLDPDFQKLADTLVYRLKNKCVGYSFIVSYKGLYKTNRSGGFSRARPETSVPMTMYSKYSFASVAKTITATALLKRFSELPGGVANLDMPVWKYLPAHWVLGPNIKTITFRMLLTHTSGFRYDILGIGNGDDYQTLKKLFANGVYTSNRVASYNNRNYSILRLIIPVLANYNIGPVSSNLTGSLLAAVENVQAIQFANAYKDYCRVTVFNKLGSTATQTIDCVNTDALPGRCYVFPASNYVVSKLPGDLSLSSGSQGWVLSTVQVNDFFTTLQYTQTLLPAAISTLMRTKLLGYDVEGNTADGIHYYWKNGIYNWGDPTMQAYRSLIIGFSDDIQITMNVNSPMVLQDIAVAAHQDWHL